jgi:hypothetical protein
MIIAGLVHSLLKAIHEWTACGRAVPTYLLLLQNSRVRIRVLGRAHSQTIWSVMKPPAACRDGRGWDRARPWCNFGCSGCGDLYVRDHGPGFDIEQAEGRSSGLCLVAALAQRLKGAFTVERRSEARCTVRFLDEMLPPDGRANAVGT